MMYKPKCNQVIRKPDPTGSGFLMQPLPSFRAGYSGASVKAGAFACILPVYTGLHPDSQAPLA